MNIIFTKAEQVLETIDWLEKQEKTVPVELLTFSYKIDCFYSEETFGKLCRLINQKFPSKTLIWDSDFNVEEHYTEFDYFCGQRGLANFLFERVIKTPDDDSMRAQQYYIDNMNFDDNGDFIKELCVLLNI